LLNKGVFFHAILLYYIPELMSIKKSHCNNH